MIVTRILESSNHWSLKLSAFAEGSFIHRRNVMKVQKLPFISAILILFCLSGLVNFVHGVHAAREIPLYAGISLDDNLLAFRGKSVTVTLSSGKQFTGIVRDVKNGLLHLERLSLKNHYDALIRTGHISAIEAQVRPE